MEFGEQEGEEGCIRKEAKEARDQGFSDGIRGRAGEVRSRPGLPRDGSWVEDGSGSFWVPLDSRGASEPSSLKSRHPRGWESPQVPEVTAWCGLGTPSPPHIPPFTWAPRTGLGTLAPRVAGRAHARV